MKRTFKRSRRSGRLLPMPPHEMRVLVGPVDNSSYDNPSAARIISSVPDEAYESVLDFGCGCGRIARQLIQQRPVPKQYLGIDLHMGMIEWCKRNLEPHATGFRFEHHDVFNAGLNPGDDKPLIRPFPSPDDEFSLVCAYSVFTHLNQSQAVHYLEEVSRVLRPDGFFYSSWFLFDKSDFPMMQEFQNALFINDCDPTNAVIFDKTWLKKRAEEVGLSMISISPPKIRGFQWVILLTPSRPGISSVEYPVETSPTGVMRPPLMPESAEMIGRTERSA